MASVPAALRLIGVGGCERSKSDGTEESGDEGGSMMSTEFMKGRREEIDEISVERYF